MLLSHRHAAPSALLSTGHPSPQCTYKLCSGAAKSLVGKCRRRLEHGTPSLSLTPSSGTSHTRTRSPSLLRTPQQPRPQALHPVHCSAYARIEQRNKKKRKKHPTNQKPEGFPLHSPPNAGYKQLETRYEQHSPPPANRTNSSLGKLSSRLCTVSTTRFSFSAASLPGRTIFTSS